MSMNPYPYEPLEANPAPNLGIIDDPMVDFFLSSFPDFPGPPIRKIHLRVLMSHWPVAISKSEDSSHTDHCGFPAAVRSRS